MIEINFEVPDEVFNRIIQYINTGKINEAKHYLNTKFTEIYKEGVQLSKLESENITISIR